MKSFSALLCSFNDSIIHLSKLALIALLCMSVSLSVSANSIAGVTASDKDGDGLSDQYEEKIGTEAYLADTDGDGINDGIEVGKNLEKPLNTDSDRYIDALDYDDDNDGLPSFLETKVDTDKDGILNYLDTDSDNDGLQDGEEAGVMKQDKNLDGIDDAFDITRAGAIDSNGDGINDNLVLPDYNKDGIPDYLDAGYQITASKKATAKKSSKVSKHKNSSKAVVDNNKTKNAGIETSQKSVKKENIKVKKKVVINRHTDTDNDGLLDSLELILGTNPRKRDSDGDMVSDAIEIGMDINAPLDSDHDNIIDALDDDDDNDGILTKNEDINKDSTPINDDTDADGVPNYLDANDDGDLLLTRDEGVKKDTDKDGIPDYLDKNDGVKDKTPQLANSKQTPDEPEVIVLFDGNEESLFEKTQFDSENDNLVEKTINDTIKSADIDAKKDQEKEVSRKNTNIKPAKKMASSSWSWDLY